MFLPGIPVLWPPSWSLLSSDPLTQDDRWMSQLTQKGNCPQSHPRSLSWEEYIAVLEEKKAAQDFKPGDGHDPNFRVTSQACTDNSHSQPGQERNGDTHVYRSLGLQTKLYHSDKWQERTFHSLQHNPVYTDISAWFQQGTCHPQPLLTQRKGIVEQDHSRLTIGDKSKVSYRRAPKRSAITIANCMFWSTQHYSLFEYQLLRYSLHTTHLANSSIYHSLLNQRKDGDRVASLSREMRLQWPPTKPAGPRFSWAQKPNMPNRSGSWWS